ncbi:DUF2079 domain-containing protein [Actinomadura algeriensis]|uniref:Membrane protein n=1 Tax=Actinomadura algeriensis TaxID=1679523 RepID=A0ABR9JN48_9ACTN|nr:DUF2079 domain-containing protein [Actinomadura algeriensis]MBE1531843.1 putative membrane protein [Actinomadura algeriensis]
MTAAAPARSAPRERTVAPAAPAAHRPPRALAGAFFAVYAAVSVSGYRAHGASSWDLGIFEQVVRSYAHLRAPVADLKGPGFVILGDHFSPVLALLGPVYRVLPSPVTLLVVQAALVAWSVLPVTRAATALAGRAAGPAVGAAYGLSWGLQRAVAFDFHEICFAVPLIAFSLEAVLARRWRAALLWALPLPLVKEDLGLTLAAIAVVVALRARSRASWWAAGVAAAGAGGCLLTIGLVIPAFNTGGEYAYWERLGGESDLWGTLVQDADTKIRTVLWILVPGTGLLALRSPLLLVLVPTLAWRFAAAELNYWGTDWHYSAILMPVVALALVDALARTRTSGPSWLRAYARRLPTAVLAASLALCTQLPVARLAHADAYRTSADARDARRALSVIPDGAEVEANVRPISRLTGRCRVFWYGDTQGVVPDYIAYHDPGASAVDMFRRARALHPDVEYGVASVAGGYWVLKRVS